MWHVAPTLTVIRWNMAPTLTLTRIWGVGCQGFVLCVLHRCHVHVLSCRAISFAGFQGAGCLAFYSAPLWGWCVSLTCIRQAYTHGPPPRRQIMKL